MKEKLQPTTQNLVYALKGVGIPVTQIRHPEHLRLTINDEFYLYFNPEKLHSRDKYLTLCTMDFDNMRCLYATDDMDDMIRYIMEGDNYER